MHARPATLPSSEAPEVAPDFACGDAGASTLQPSLQYAPRAKEAGGYVGMPWEAALPHGLPALSDDGLSVAHWVGEDAYSSPSPVYDRAVVVIDLSGTERSRHFRLLEHDEVWRALPDGESPTPRAALLSRHRLLELEEQVRGRVALANEWLGAHQWSPMRVCRPDVAVQAVRVSDLRISLARAATSGRGLIEVRRVDGALLLQREEELGPCDGEPRLVSVALMSSAAVLVEVATTSNDSCSAPNRVHAYGLRSSPEAPGRATRPAVAGGCAPARELSEDERLGMYRYERSDLSAFRVSPADRLNLRARPGNRAPLVDKLPFLFSGLRHTGSACLADGGLWLEVEHGKRRGWVSAHHVAPAAAFHRVELDEDRAQQLSAPHLVELARRLRDALAREHTKLAGARVDVELVGHRERGGVAEIALFVTPVGSDSSLGFEYVAFAVLDAGRWRLEAVEARDICSRGSGGGYCV
jgi:uncharacterized protein YraI